MNSTGHLKNHWLLSTIPVVVLATFIFLLVLIASGDLTSVRNGTVTTSNKSIWSATLNTSHQTAAKDKIGMIFNVCMLLYYGVEVDAAGAEAAGPMLWSSTLTKSHEYY